MYELVDFGFGRKLEQIAGRLIDRPCPAADGIPCRRDPWPKADAIFQMNKGHQGTWQRRDSWTDSWTFQENFGLLELSLSPFGHIGVFPEQANNWTWIRMNSGSIKETRLLNLFGYSGASTLAAASAGATVTHVDSAKNIVNRARSNAERSGLGQRPVRWIVEDALRFVEREVRRGSSYDGVILDPPTYGHGVSKGQLWNIDEDLPRLLASLADLIPQCQVMLCTCHSPGISVTVLMQMLANRMSIPENTEFGEMNLCSKDGRQLSAGVFVRWIST